MAVLDIIDAIAEGPEGSGRKPVTLCGVHPVTFEVLIPEFTLQFWPENLSDSPEIGWDFKELPGASHALAQWTSNGGRTFTFDVRYSRYMRPYDKLGRIDKVLNFANKPDDHPHTNVDIAYEIRRLRALAYPNYDVSHGLGGSLSGEEMAVSPVIVLMNFPNMHLNEDGGDTVWSVMTTCDAVYNLSFPDGTPRQATVSIALRQIVQKEGGINFPEHSRAALLDPSVYQPEPGLGGEGPYGPTTPLKTGGS